MKSTFLVLTITAGLLAATELALRVLFPGELVEYQRELERAAKSAFKYHPERLFSLKPNVKRTYVDPDWLPAEPGFVPVDWSTNSLGQRGEEPSQDADVRIIVYGDSNIHARFTDLDETFPKQLEQFLSKRSNRTVEVLNAGVDGYGPDQSYLYMRSNQQLLEPDLVVFHVFADNDLGDLLRNRLFDVNEAGDLVESGLPITEDKLLQPQISRFLIVRGTNSIGRKLSAVLSSQDGPTAEEYLKTSMAFHNRDFQIYSRGGRRRGDSGFTDPFDYDVALFPNSASATAKLTMMRAILTKVASDSAEFGVPVFVLVQPSSVDIFGDPRFPIEAMKSYREFRSERHSGYIEQMAKEAELPTLNLFAQFSGGNPTEFYRTYDRRHWNSAGQELAARLTADRLLKDFEYLFH